MDAEDLFELAIESGADDVREDGDFFEVICPADAYQQLADTFEIRKIPTEVAEITRIPENTVELGLQDGRKLLKMMEAFEENEDVQSVTANFNIADEILEELAAEG